MCKIGSVVGAPVANTPVANTRVADDPARQERRAERKFPFGEFAPLTDSLFLSFPKNCKSFPKANERITKGSFPGQSLVTP